MSDCCSSSNESNELNKSSASVNKTASKHKCPSDGLNYSKVSYSTVIHHVKNPWKRQLPEQEYYFCDSSDCDVVYFGADDCIITKEMVRTPIGVKEKSDDSLICYCFDVTRADAKADGSAQKFVLEQTRKSNCSCKTSNPSGNCCLKDFKKI